MKHERSHQEVQDQLRTREELAQDPARWRLATTVTAWSLDGTLYLIDGLVPDPDDATVLIRDAQTTRQRQLSKARLNQAAGSQLSSPRPMPGGSRAGSIYVLLNPRDPDAVKIGGTARTAEERAKEISQATGVPVPLVVICEERVDDWRAAEAELHAKLDAHRLPNREFFTIPAKDAVALVRAVAARFPAPAQRSPPQIGLVIKEIQSAVVVDSVTRGSAAETAGIRPGDVIETWDGVAVSSVATIQASVPALRLDVAVRRAGARLSFSIHPPTQRAPART